jgi:3-deoxy-D-manno-octulosonic acid kinase
MSWRDEPGEVPDGFAALEAGGATVLARRGFEAMAAEVATRASWDGVAESLGGGRIRHPVVRLPDGGRAVVRRYRRGGLVRHLVEELYLTGHRAFDELRATERAAAGGARVPRVLAAVERRRPIGYTALLVTELVEGAVDLAEWLRGSPAPARERALRCAGAQVALVHGAGLSHPDLNLRNFLVREDGGEVWVLDFDRARRLPPSGRRRRAADITRLLRSAGKLDLAPGPEGERALRAGYGPSWPLATAPERGA